MAAASGIQVANAPCSWGVLEFDHTAEPLGYAQVLDEMAAAGYAGTELGDWGFMPTEPARLRDELDQRGLCLLGAFVPVALEDRQAHGPGIEAALRTARLLAASSGERCFIVLAAENGADPVRTRIAGRVDAAQGLSKAQWAVFAEGAEALARAVRDETGLRTVFHHHGAGFVETPAETAALLDRTDPKLLGLCLDTGHWAFGGGDPVDALRTHRERIWHVHFKDYDASVADYQDYFDAVRQGVFCELGKGDVAFSAVLAELEGSGYQDWIVVEQDVLPGMGTPLESAQRNRSFLASLGL
jgi:inosose dehydratase